MNEIKDPALECLMITASYYRMPLDVTKLSHQMALNRKWTTGDLLIAAKKVGFKAAASKIHEGRLKKAILPIIIRTDDSFAVLAKVNDDKCLVLFAGENAPRSIEIKALYSQWNGECILLTPRKGKYRDTKFGFKWFIPTITKFKGPLIEVLVAALVMQLLALCSPLITQSVIDKVLVHNSLSTLDVLAIALVMITLFETVLSVARTYIFSHTASKIDVILSSRLFDHLFKLPLRYF